MINLTIKENANGATQHEMNMLLDKLEKYPIYSYQLYLADAAEWLYRETLKDVMKVRFEISGWSIKDVVSYASL